MSGKPDQITAILTTPDGVQVIVLTDGTTLELSTMDIGMLSGAFPGECEACGYNPDEDDVDITEEGDGDG